MSGPYTENKYKPKEGRLDKSNKAWCSDQTDARFLITLPEQTTVFGVATQGNPVEDNWVTKYKLNVCSTHVNLHINNNDDANTNPNTIVNYMVESSPPCYGGVLRFLPLSWEGDKKCMRVEIYGINEG